MSNEPDSDMRPRSGSDHDLLIRIDENVKAIKREQVNIKGMLENHTEKIFTLETTQSEQRGGWKAMATAGTVGAAIASAFGWIKDHLR